MKKQETIQDGESSKLSEASFDLLGDLQQQQDFEKSAGASSADEDYFGENNHGKMSTAGSELDFQHVYSMNEKASAMNEFSDFLGKSREKNIADATQAFMSAERDFLGDHHQYAKNTTSMGDALMMGLENRHQPDPVVTNSQKITDIYDDDFFRAPKPNSADSPNSGNESPAVSCNPSPVKKNPVTDTLKEQENEKFISSEDLLGDFKDDRSSTPEFHNAAAVAAAAAAATSESNTKQPVTKSDKIVTDLDDDKPMPSAPENSKVENIERPPASETNKKPTPIVSPIASSSSKYDKKENKNAESKDPKILSVEAVFYKYGLDAWFKPERLHPRVESLIYWRDVKKSGIVFGAGIITLLAISCFSVISVFAYLSLISLTGTIGFRIYKSVMQAIQKTSDGHPFKEFLELDLTLSQEKIQQFVSVAVAHINGFVAELRRLFLVEDLIDSLKFGVILWVMTYIGAWFNGMTLVILAFVSLFTLPKVYENNKQSIDTYLDLVRSKLTEITDKVKVAIPIGNKKPISTETDKDK